MLDIPLWSGHSSQAEDHWLSSDFRHQREAKQTSSLLTVTVHGVLRPKVRCPRSNKDNTTVGMNVTHFFLLPRWILSRRCLKIVISPRCGVIMNCKRELDTDQVAQMCSSDGILWLKREFPFQARVGPRCAGPQAALPCWLPLLHTRRQRHVIPSRHVATWHVTSRRCAHAHVDGTRPPPLYRPQLLPTHRTVRASQLCQSR